MVGWARTSSGWSEWEAASSVLEDLLIVEDLMARTTPGKTWDRPPEDVFQPGAPSAAAGPRAGGHGDRRRSRRRKTAGTEGRKGPSGGSMAALRKRKARRAG